MERTMSNVIPWSWRALVVAVVVWGVGHSPSCRAGTMFDFALSFDPNLGGSNDYLSDLVVMGYVNQPGFPHEFILPLGPSHIAVSNPDGFHFSFLDSFASSPDYAQG